MGWLHHHPTVASAVEKTQVYLREHLPICCHLLSATMELVREPLTQDVVMLGNDMRLEINTIDTKQKSTCILFVCLFQKPTTGWFGYSILKTLPLCP